MAFGGNQRTLWAIADQENGLARAPRTSFESVGDHLTRALDVHLKRATESDGALPENAYRQPSSGATNVRMLSMAWAL
jgi:hypothetical protein